MMNMRNSKKNRMIASVICIIIVVAMIATSFIGAFF